jgi:hypothetical protein
MPILRSKLNSSDDINNDYGSITFTKDGIKLAHPSGNYVTIGPTGIGLFCGGISMKMATNEIVLSASTVSVRLTTSDFSVATSGCNITSSGVMRLNGAIVNINNGGLEVT